MHPSQLLIISINSWKSISPSPFVSTCFNNSLVPSRKMGSPSLFSLQASGCDHDRNSNSNGHMSSGTGKLLPNPYRDSRTAHGAAHSRSAVPVPCETCPARRRLPALLQAFSGWSRQRVSRQTDRQIDRNMCACMQECSHRTSAAIAESWFMHVSSQHHRQTG